MEANVEKLKEAKKEELDPSKIKSMFENAIDIIKEVGDTSEKVSKGNEKISLIGNPTRGAIKVEVSTSEPIITSASDFSIFVVIRNPYNVPIIVYWVQTHIPIELLDVVWEDNYKVSNLNDRLRRIEAMPSNSSKIGIRIAFAWEDFIRLFRPIKGPRIAEAVSVDVKSLKASAEISPARKDIVFGDVKTGGKVVIGDFADYWELNFPTNPTNEELDRVFRKVDDYRAGRIPILLQPGNALIKQFVLRARKSVFFTPIEYTFQIQTKYAVDNLEQFEVVPFKLNIRAAMSSTIIGSLIGGIVGTLAQMLSKGQTIALGAVGLAAIFSAVAVVAFARKANAQQIISVEDFWGGFFIGFLIGYLGEGYFKNIIGQNP